MHIASRRHWRAIGRPTLEIHLPISPTPNFFTMVRYFAASLQLVGGPLADSPIIVTVGADQEPVDLTFPWANRYPIEWVWVDRTLFRRHGYYATALERFRRPFRAPMVMIADADTFFAGRFDDIVASLHRKPAFAGLIAHMSPFTGLASRTSVQWWEELFRAADLPPPSLECEHTGWGAFGSDPSDRHCPPYFNLGVLLAPAAYVTRIGERIYEEMRHVDSVLETGYRCQLALTLTIERLRIPWQALPMRYNFPNDEQIAARYPQELRDVRLFHYLRVGPVDKRRDFDSENSVAALLRRRDLSGVNVVMQERLARVHASMSDKKRAAPSLPTPDTRDMTFTVHVSSRGNIFMRELAGYLLEALGVGGVAAVAEEGIPPVGRSLNIILAPHEYCSLDPAFATADRDEVLRRCIVVNTEQPGTPWFESSAAFCAKAGLVFDINTDGVRALRARGIVAHYFPLCHQPRHDRWQGTDTSLRDIDVLFMGDLNVRRSELLAQYAHLLAPYRFELFPTDSSCPIRAEGRHFVLGSAKAEVLRRARILLDIHRGPHAYFAWQRAIPAFANGAVVVTEPSPGLDPLQAFDHLVVAQYDLIPHYVQALLLDEPRRRTIASRAYDFLTTRLTPENTWAAVAVPLTDFARRSAAEQTFMSPTGHRESPSATGEGWWSVLDSNGVPRRRSRISPPHDIAPQPPAASQGAILKKLLLSNRCLERQLGAMRLREGRTLAPQGPPPPEVTAAWDAQVGDVSVIVTVHNYEQFVDECLGSVLASVDVLPEVIVVDDASSDGSATRVRRFMTAHPELPIAFVTLPVNHGLPFARNEGFRRARSEHVLVLDVDNLLYPRALARLRQALLGSAAGFSYCVIEQFGEMCGLMSKHPWDVQRLLRGNYIDALAMIRRRTWEHVGGYVEGAEAETLYGWEDWDFWLGCAERGIAGTFVPEILARYRTRGGSMISITNLYTEPALALLRARHSRLPWTED
ncbi:MAG TPA: glycosyltransferase family A protein [Candidatus Binatia bacterium]|nr:glycosyltransferase family A protein [Candidatus Binatia bacterium]